MLGSVFKGLALLVSTAIAVPYTVALLCNVLYGWPQVRCKYRRAFHPKKVFALNYSVVQKLTLLRFFCLYWKWKYYYTNAPRSELIKDVPFGRNYRTLDIYCSQLGLSSQLKPVVIFVYGGAWGSGDKHIYCLLCSQISERLGAVVCCPNYSLYPQGYVDDMIQDVVDCISWTYENIETYGGDKDKIILIGHSAGAHLSAMAILELLHDERVLQTRSGKGRQLQFDEQHYDGTNSNHNHADSSESSDSFAIVSENGGEGQNLEGSNSASMFEVINGEQNRSVSETSFEKGVVDVGHDGGGDEIHKSASVKPVMARTIQGQERLREADAGQGEEAGQGEGEGHVEGEGREDVEEEEEDTGDDDDSVVTVKPKDIERHPTLVDLCKSVKAFIGLAGVYQIEDHYHHEASRGMEDVSSMARAMYGEDHFDRFSPTVIIKNLSGSISLPKIVLVHGTEDYVVPLTSTTKFAAALSDIQADVTVRIVPGCDHYELCLDLMDPGRKHFDSVMGIILESAGHIV